jgi:two-component system chemotaxis sensor kinase CheA
MLRAGAALPPELVEAQDAADRLLLDLQEEVTSIRMVPVELAFRKHVRTVREAARSQRKQVQLVIEGGDIEADDSVLEQIRDPLTHLVRNAVDHGIESPAEREAAGKPRCGTLTLRARHAAGHVVVELADDGRGIDEARVAQVARQRGFVPAGAHPPEDELLRLLFEPGFTTTSEVTEYSGRGVGLDAVRKNVESLRGSISVRSEAGRGATFTIRLPLTVAIVRGFAVVVEGETLVIPLENVVECLALPGGPKGASSATGILNHRGKPLPFVRLRDRLGLRAPDGARENVVVVQHEDLQAGIAVDELRGETQAVIKPLGPLFSDLSLVSQSMILGDGRVALILDVGGLLRELHSAPETLSATC